MAIGTGDAIEKFGAQSAVTNAGVSIADGAMSTDGDAVTWTNSDDAPEADLVFEGTFGSAPSASTSISIYARKLAVRSTNDENVPSISDNENHLLNSFPLDSSGTTQVKTARVQLPNGKSSQQYKFHFKNNGGQNLNSAQFWITPIASGPA